MDSDIQEVQKDISDFLRKKYGKRVQLAGSNVLQKAEHDTENANEEQTGELSITFDMKPSELKAYLDQYLVKQDDAKQVLATKICTHFNRINKFDLENRDQDRPDGRGSKDCPGKDRVGEIKNNIIMIGPTGVGKTFLIKLIARRIGVPFVKGDATKFSETGYVGGDVDDLVRDLVHEADGNLELAQYGIIYLDEIDKIAASSNIVGPDVSRAGVQRALLKPMEEAEVELRAAHDPVAQMEALMQFQKTGERERKRLNTRNILFIVSGAFSGLEEIVKKRLNRQGIGFGAQIESKDERMRCLRQVKAEDLVDYGFESEFIGRLPVVTVFEHLEADDLYQILCNPKSPVMSSKKRDFKSYGIDVQFEDAALQMIAQQAHEEKTGARGLVSALERSLLKFEHVLPSTDITRFVVTERVIEDPETQLESLLCKSTDTTLEEAFQRLVQQEQAALADTLRKSTAELRQRCGLDFPDHRIALITARVVQERYDLDRVVEELIAIHRAGHEFEDGFAQHHGIPLTFTEEALDRLVARVWRENLDPTSFLEDSFRDYVHGIKLMRERSGLQRLVLPAEALEDPKSYLTHLIQETYQE